jgi:hypothetical protein
LEGTSAEEDAEDEEASDELVTSTPQSKLLIANRELESVGPLDLDKQTRQETDRNDKTLRIFGLEENNGLICPACRGRESGRKALFSFGRIGAPYFLGSILPTLLEYAPDGEKPAMHPSRGRRLLTFNDSRQGTARMAARLQQESERNRVRSLVYHMTLKHWKETAVHDGQDLKEQIEQLENGLIPGLPEAARKALEGQLERLRKQQDSLLRPTQSDSTSSPNN